MESDEGPAGEWIVKPAGRHPHGNLALLRELAGASVAAWLGLLVPAVELVLLPPDSSSPGGALTHPSLRAHAGQYAFCSRHVQASRFEQQALFNASTPESLVREGLQLLMLDVLLWHYDRTPGNPNALLWRGHLVAIDHDSAFRDIQALDENSGLGVDFETLSFRETSWGDHLAWPLLAAHPGLAAGVAAQVAGRWQQMDDQHLMTWVDSWPDGLDRGRTEMPAGYKTTLRQFLSTRRREASSLLASLLTTEALWHP